MYWWTRIVTKTLFWSQAAMATLLNQYPRRHNSRHTGRYSPVLLISLSLYSVDCLISIPADGTGVLAGGAFSSCFLNGFLMIGILSSACLIARRSNHPRTYSTLKVWAAVAATVSQPRLLLHPEPAPGQPHGNALRGRAGGYSWPHSGDIYPLYFAHSITAATGLYLTLPTVVY